MIKTEFFLTSFIAYTDSLTLNILLRYIRVLSITYILIDLSLLWMFYVYIIEYLPWVLSESFTMEILFDNTVNHKESYGIQ